MSLEKKQVEEIETLLHKSILEHVQEQRKLSSKLFMAGGVTSAINSVLDQAVGDGLLVPVHPPRIENTYLVVPSSKRDLLWCNSNWNLSTTHHNFSSRRIAKTWIKMNLGAVCIGFTAHLPGAIHYVEITGTIDL
jgi:hypothetical protein